MPERTVDEETAGLEFDRFAEAWCLDSDTVAMDEEDRDTFNTLRRKLVRAIGFGFLTVDESGEKLTYALRYPRTGGLTELELRPPLGSALTDLDKYKERQAMHKLNSYLASVCRTNPAVFSQMDQRDLKIPQAVITLFLGS